MVHQYGYNRTDEPTHMLRPHPQPQSSISMVSSPSRQPAYQSRQASANSVYPPVLEEPEDNDDPTSAASAPMEKVRHVSYLDPYERPKSAVPASTSSRGHPSLFHISTSADPSTFRKSRSHSKGESPSSRSRSKDKEIRGSSRRGTKDYPHLSKREAGVEKEERRALVRDDGDERFAQDSGSDTEGRASYDEPKSAITDESMGDIFKAVKRSVPEYSDIPPVPSRAGGYDSPTTPRGPR